MAFLTFAESGKVTAAFLVFFNPLAGKAAVLNARQDFFHGRARGIWHHPRATSEITVLGGIGDGIAHPCQPTLVDKVDDQLHLMQTLKVSDLGLITRLDQSFESLLDERSQSAAEYSLFSEQIA